MCGFFFLSQQYILSGSDDFNLYMWRIPADPEAGKYIPSMNLLLMLALLIDLWHMLCPEGSDL